jgi:hypothetical protein
MDTAAPKRRSECATRFAVLKPEKKRRSEEGGEGRREGRGRARSWSETVKDVFTLHFVCCTGRRLLRVAASSPRAVRRR